MHDARGLDHALLLETEIADVLEQPLTVAEHERHDVQLQLVDQPRRQVLLHGVRAAGDQDVAITGRLIGSVERRCDPSVTKKNVVPPSIGCGSRA